MKKCQTLRNRGKVSDTFSLAIATAGGLGHAPIASGTVASAAAALLWYLIPLQPAAQWFAAIALTLIGIWASARTAAAVHDEDPSIVVIDEVAGMWLALAAAPRTLPVVIVAFCLFRTFDIGKWPPMRQLERLPGGWGIMMDDVAAGLISRAFLAVGLLWFAQ